MSPPQRTHPRAGSGGRRRSGQLQRPSVLPSTCPPSLSIHRSPEPPSPDDHPPPQAPSDPRRLPGPRRGGSCWAEPALGGPVPGEPLGCSPRGEGPYREAGPTLPGPPRPGGGGERDENARRGRSSAAPRGTPGSVPVPAPGAGSRELRGRSARNLSGAEPVCLPGSPPPRFLASLRLPVPAGVPGTGPAMPAAYPQRALTVLLLFGTLAAAMALLASSLIFQLPSGRAGPGPGPGRGSLPEPAAAVLLPVSAVLAALCLVLNVSCLLLCLLHGYFSTELCRGQPGPDR